MKPLATHPTLTEHLQPHDALQLHDTVICPTHTCVSAASVFVQGAQVCTRPPSCVLGPHDYGFTVGRRQHGMAVGLRDLYGQPVQAQCPRCVLGHPRHLSCQPVPCFGLNINPVGLMDTTAGPHVTYPPQRHLAWRSSRHAEYMSLTSLTGLTACDPPSTAGCGQSL